MKQHEYIQKVLKENGYEFETESLLEITELVLLGMIDHLEQEEPQARRSIQCLKDARDEVNCSYDEEE